MHAETEDECLPVTKNNNIKKNVTMYVNENNSRNYV